MEVWRAGFPDEAEALLLASAEVMGLQAQDLAVGFQVARLRGRDSTVGLQAAGLQARDSTVGFQVVGLQTRDSTVGFQAVGLQGRDSTLGFIRVSFITSFTIRISSSFRPASGAGDTRGTGGILGTGTTPLITTPTITHTTTHMMMPTTGSMGPLRTVTGLLPEVRIPRSKLRSRVGAIIGDQLTG
jgi:hypothetical protein